MRVSADKADRDFSHAAAFLKVFLDGAELSMCITADDGRGEVTCYELDEKGHIRMDPSSERPKTVTYTGKVEIVVGQEVSSCDRELTAEQLVEKYRCLK